MTNNLGFLLEGTLHDEYHVLNPRLVPGDRVEVVCGVWEGEKGVVDLTSPFVRKMRCWMVLLDGHDKPAQLLDNDLRYVEE